MIGGGAILLYIAVILAVVPVGEGDSARATALCVITPWFTAIGYSLCYGTILVKMFRTWYIFNKPIANKKEVCIMNVHNSLIMTISNYAQFKKVCSIIYDVYVMLLQCQRMPFIH